MYDEAVRREHDLDSLKEYVRDYLVGQHIRFYDDVPVMKSMPKMSTVNSAVKPQVKTDETKNSGKMETTYVASKKLAENKREAVVHCDESKKQSNFVLRGKSKQLESLFRMWEIEQKNEPDDIWELTNGGNENITKTHFRRDGIIDEVTFEREKVKVLFISAEANDNAYSALTNPTLNSVEDYREYNHTGVETWKGRMRERLAEMYKVISGTERGSMPNSEAVMHFAIMDINKRGGGSSIKSGEHLEHYCRYYAKYIRREIEIIDPDIVAIIGSNLYGKNLHGKYLGAESVDGKYYFDLEGKKVPILSLWQTSVYTGRNEPLAGYEDNRIIGKQAARCADEMKRFGIR